MAYHVLIPLFLTFLAAYILYRRLLDPLHNHPGPFLASLTDAYRSLDGIINSTGPPTLIKLHAKHGDVVRIGPNALSFAHPDAIRDIYGADKKFPKSRFYWSGAAVVRGRPNPTLFSHTDLQWHDTLRRAVQPAFNLSALVQYEPFVDGRIACLLEQFRGRFVDRRGSEVVLPLQLWMHWYAADVVSGLTWGEPLGFMEQARDVDGILEKTNWYLAYILNVGSMPSLDNLLLKNPVLLWFNRRGWFIRKPHPVAAFALERQNARLRDRAARKEDPDRVDMLDKFIQAMEKNPDTVSEKAILGVSMSQLFAGSESTAVTLTMLLYHLMKQPRIYKKLQAEIDSNLADIEPGELVSFRAAQKLPYLDACVKETFRIHPAGRFSPERVLPTEGATIAGQHIPGNTVVGVNAWVLHRRPEIFGDDVEEFVPERWLASSPAEEQKVAEMNRTLFHFGAGRFSCIGKHISTLEMYKVIPTLLRAFEFELDKPDRELMFERGLFVTLANVDSRIRSRR